LLDQRGRGCMCVNDLLLNASLVHRPSTPKWLNQDKAPFPLARMEMTDIQWDRLSRDLVCARPTRFQSGGMIHHAKHLGGSSIAHQIDARAVPVVVEVPSLDGFGGTVGVEQSDTFTAGMADARIDEAI